jgi:hypothetical protein
MLLPSLSEAEEEASLSLSGEPPSRGELSSLEGEGLAWGDGLLGFGVGVLPLETGGVLALEDVDLSEGLEEAFVCASKGAGRLPFRRLEDGLLLRLAAAAFFEDWVLLPAVTTAVLIISKSRSSAVWMAGVLATAFDFFLFRLDILPHWCFVGRMSIEDFFLWSEWERCIGKKIKNVFGRDVFVRDVFITNRFVPPPIFAIKNIIIGDHKYFQPADMFRSTSPWQASRRGRLMVSPHRRSPTKALGPSPLKPTRSNGFPEGTRVSFTGD